MSAASSPHWRGCDVAKNYRERWPHPVCVELRRLRQARGLSLDAVATRTGITAVTIGSYERGDRSPVVEHEGNLDKLLAFYGRRLTLAPAEADPVEGALTELLHRHRQGLGHHQGHLDTVDVDLLRAAIGGGGHA